MNMQRFDLVKVEDYAHKGARKTRSWKVGKALSMRRGGFMIFVPEGMAVSGRLMMVPEQGTFGEIDLIEAYASAAEEFGV
ncbi:hypothetical protein [Salinarimonas rosea]|uniref:hypothetical protein n=1 Tax=Salinarimonas rosea TaxID=552063 RepID=UPI00041414B7|nr:hypothetical protein [Salinarimonas rosea]